MQRWRAVAMMVGVVACGDSVQRADVDAGPPPPKPYSPLAESLALSEVALFQAVKATLVSEGARVSARNAPVIAGRPGVMRVYVAPVDGAQPKKLTAELHLIRGGNPLGVIEDTKTIRRASSDADPSSTFAFALTSDQLAMDVEFSILVRDPAALAPEEGRITYPADGTTDPLDAQPNANVKVVIVPVRYDFDASGRLPDTGAAQLDRYRDTVYRMYPAANVDVTARVAWPWPGQIGADGTGWDELLQGLVDLRAADNPTSDTYYVAAFEPAATIHDYCKGGCILGVAPLIPQFDVQDRIAAIIGYSGQSAANTLNQELAHAMGREHAPCGGAGGPDKKYPYAGGEIGVWGYDVLDAAFIDPDGPERDFMGYCSPIWVSDYTYTGLYGRIRSVNAAKKSWAASGIAADTIFIGRDGVPRRGRPTSVPTTGATPLPFVGVRRRGWWAPYDNIPGGIALSSRRD